MKKKWKNVSIIGFDSTRPLLMAFSHFISSKTSNAGSSVALTADEECGVPIES